MDVEDFAELNEELRVVRDEFDSKIAFDFNKVIFLSLRGGTIKDLKEVVSMAAARDGYEGHRTIRYKNGVVIHFYARFRNSACAEKAIVYFRAMDKNFNADIVKNILLTFYMIERVLVLKEWNPNAEASKVCTSTYVDTQGNADIPNPLSTSNVRSLLLPFGCPRVIQSNETSPRFIKVQFSSMAEALAATIVTGRWFYYTEQIGNHQSAYRVRIVGKKKETEILTKSGSSPPEAFEMEYFVPASEVDPDDFESYDDDSSESFSRSKSKGKYSTSHGRRKHNDKYRYQGPYTKGKSASKSDEIPNALGKEFSLIVNIS